ncbi:MAG: hotdog fold thioesterase, partial [SAR202 cluster bacterium]|nr:hotdog fold thioesterase [SAR202 cluster bacterium]
IGGGIKVYSNNETVVGIEINANHLKSVRDGWVYGKATPIRIGKKIQVWNIEITNEDDDLICVSRLTLAVISKK